MENLAGCKIDSCTRSIDDFDLDIVARSVTQEVEHMVKILAIKKNALQNVKGRVATLHATLLDQEMSTVHSLRSAFLAKVRLCEAERAISRALGATPHCVEIEQHTAKHERDAARRMASQLKLRVEVLRLFQGNGVGKLLKSTCLRLEDSLNLLSSELTDLVTHHRTLLAMSTQNKSVLQERACTPDRRLQLEAHWMHMSCTLDSLNDKLKKSKSVPCVTSSDLVLLKETQARSDSLHQLCVEIEQIGSLF